MEGPLIILALLGGFVGSLMSGGSIVVFFILTLLDLPIKVAIGTLKMVIAGLTLVSSLSYLRAGVLDMRLASSLTVCALAGAYLGSFVVLSIPEQWARILVAIFLIVGAYFTLRGEEEGGSCSWWEPVALFDWCWPGFLHRGSGTGLYPRCNLGPEPFLQA